MKKGISLIVLVITIIVIIILAGAVILSLSNNNPIAQAETAVADSDLDTVQSAVTLYLANLMAEGKGAATITPAGTVTDGVGDLDQATVVAGTESGTITAAVLGVPTLEGYKVDGTGTVSK